MKTTENFGDFLNNRNKEGYTLNKDACTYILTTIYKVFNLYNIDFFLVFGTLLGAYRDKDFISHDTDIDLGILYKDLNNLINSVPDIEKYGIKLKRNSPELLSFVYESDYIDIYVFNKDDSDPKYYRCSVYNIESFQIDNGFTKIEFLGQYFNTVNDIEKYLIRHYGNDWNEPIMNKHAIF